MIKEISTPKLKNPIFIAAWPGMGEVAYRTVLFLKEVLGAKVFAKLEPYRFFKPAAVTVQKGVLSMPSQPAGFFYYYKGKDAPDMIIFLGEIQPPLEYAETLSAAIVNYIKRYKVNTIVTFAAKPEPIDHKNESRVWVAATHNEAIKSFDKAGVKALPEGQISGLNGIILGVGKRRNLKGICFLGEIPFYTVQIENPKATAKILEVLNTYLKMSLNLAPLFERAKFIEEEIDKLINYIKGDAPQNIPSPLNEEDIDKIKKDLAAYTKLPQSAREKIESLFKESEKDISLANQLKTELDHWNVYKEYEDKFLDLFRKKHRKEDTH
ncbi:MAG: PAC2 family protein [Candidatus Omnitrophica bacterium]|nr:PAC2 family protein [Candidatus Omnitrophota bacterium]MBU2044241.1 PAC2 family protein [Candidatus Omnitrophota bacterium]MBU2266198.1 PAC2 family protein [Candidatus Omnitrophota bacterium]MBU2473442.1 PAC2 family protein [Candidatus Omnitrophota bacterium]